MTGFEQLKLTRQFINALVDMGFTDPTEIQVKAIPSILNGQHVVGIAPTGTGKTAAYGLPLLQMLKYAKGDQIRALVLAPSKELVIQIHEKLAELAKYTDLRVYGIFGGVGPKAQIDQIAKGVDILVATPGRFLEIYLKGKLPTKQIKHLVLDEADKMMDMGFMPQLRNVLEVIPRKRQNLLFSATFSQRVELLSEEFLEFPIRIEVEPQGTPVKRINQRIISAKNRLTKINYLSWIFKDSQLERVIIFTKTREAATAVYHTLENLESGCSRLLHANKGQNFRINSYRDFQEGNVRFLVTTDVVARGIDITDVSHVINFDVPMRYEDYVHRIGRTGRAGKSGESITLIQDDDRWHIKKIEKLIGMSIPQEDLPKEVAVGDFLPGEEKHILREIDRRKKQEDPSFQGAFHEKKKTLMKKGLWKGKKRG